MSSHPHMKPQDPRQQHHMYGGVEHRTTDHVEGCLLCTLEAVAKAWFEWDQQALDALLHDYRESDEPPDPGPGREWVEVDGETLNLTHAEADDWLERGAAVGEE